jgi:Flp pilus assembly protein TadG
MLGDIMKRLLRKKCLRRGTTVVETAIMAPLIVTTMFGMLAVGYAFMVKQTVTLAAREGARSGALPGGNMDDIQAAVASSMAAASLSGYTVTSNADSLGPTDLEVWVQVNMPINHTTFGGLLLNGMSFDLSSKTAMRREGVEDSAPAGGVEPAP